MTLSESLLYKRDYQVGEHIILNIPTLGDVLDAEDGFYRALDMFTAMPIDFMVPLDDAGIDFTAIDDWQLFLLLFNTAKSGASVARFDILFKNVNMLDFQLARKDGSDDVVLINPALGFVFDKLLYRHVSTAMCGIYGRKKDTRKPANIEAKKYLIEVERKKLKRRMRRKKKSELETLIVALVNTEQFKYNYETVRDLTIYQFNESAKQIVHKVDYSNKMHGVYSGVLDAKTLSSNELDWLTHD